MQNSYINLTKSELSDMLNIGSTKMWNLLNVEYKDELEKVGYKKRCRILTPKVLKRFFELYGMPLSESDLKELI